MTALVTAIFGAIDEKKEVPEQSIEFNEHFFDETCLWMIDELTEKSDRIKALWFKSQAHQVLTEDIFLWIDGKIKITCYDFIEQCLNALGENDIAIMKHHWRSCIYEEVDHIEHCIKHSNEYLSTRYAHRPLRKEVEFYRSQGYPEKNGLNDCCVIIRRNNTKMNDMFDEWWSLCKEDYFDQVAIQYLCWKGGVKIQPIIFKPGSYIDVPHIKLQ